MRASGAIFDSRGGFLGVMLSDEDIAHIWLSIHAVHIGATWRIRLSRPCASLCRITLTTCYFYVYTLKCLAGPARSRSGSKLPVTDDSLID